jgi:cullin-associated NEDD8-dissociated protein 1
VRTRTKGFGFTHISKVISGILSKASLAKQCYPAIAQCMGVLCATTTEKNRTAYIENYLEVIRKPGEDTQKLITLLCLGEVGRRVNLQNHSGLEYLLANIFDDSVSEEFKSTAAGTLGSVAVGNLSKYLPFILEDLSAHRERQYFLLLALREVISRQSKTPLGVKELFSHLQSAQLDLLLGYCQAPKVGVRNVVAECLGRLAIVRPQEMLDKLSLKLNSTDSPFDRSTAVTALKFAIMDYDPLGELDQLLESKIRLFLNPLSDTDLVNIFIFILRDCE